MPSALQQRSGSKQNPWRSGSLAPNEPAGRTRPGKPVRNFYLALGLLFLNGSIPSFRPAFAQPSHPSGGRAPCTTVRATTVCDLAASPDAKLTLRVYNYAHIDPVLLARSKKVAATIFENVGVEINWMDCALSKEKVWAYPACQTNMGTTDVVVRILPRDMAIKLRTTNEPLGFAQMCRENDPACELSVFYHRVDELATNGYRADLILGYVMAHEVAHVLIGPGHSEIGIMRGEWSRDDLQRVSWGLSLGFIDQQSRQLRSAVLRRATLAARASQTN